MGKLMLKSHVKPSIVIISDASGQTCELAYERMRDQYPRLPETPTIYRNVSTVSELVKIFTSAATENTFVLYTLVVTELNRAAKELASQGRVPSRDLFDPLMADLGTWLGDTPTRLPGHDNNVQDLKRLIAMRWHNGDGSSHDVQRIAEAQVVIIGVALTTKGPVCQILATKGIIAVPVKIQYGVMPPVELLRKARGIVIVFKTSQSLLTQARRGLNKIAQRNGDEAPVPSADPTVIAEELLMVEELLRQHPSWREIDVSVRNVEETASLIEGFLAETSDRPPMLLSAL
jgi:regulator of PEP synthase PpsR (kinase-PPPase family)